MADLTGLFDSRYDSHNQDCYTLMMKEMVCEIFISHLDLPLHEVAY